jgi:para-aminobenzoate synthetase
MLPPLCLAGISLQLLRAQLPFPILGVCLGFQALALAHGGRITHAPEPVHGRLSCVAHSGHPLFAGIPSGPAYAVVRYHSLLVEEASLPGCLQGIAWTCGQHHALRLGEDAVQGDPAINGGHAADQLLMALAHRSLPHWGVQFHPESVATGYGPALLRNFAALTAEHHGMTAPPLPPPLLARLAGKWGRVSSFMWLCVLGVQPACSTANHACWVAGPPGSELPPRAWGEAAQPGNLRLHHRRLPGLLAACGGSEALFWRLFGGSGTHMAADTFWLDSATPDRARFSFMGGRGGSLWRRIEYRLPPPPSVATAACAASGSSTAQRQAGAAAETRGGSGAVRGTLVLTSADGRQQTLRTDFFGWLEGLLRTQRCRVWCAHDAAAQCPHPAPAMLAPVPALAPTPPRPSHPPTPPPCSPEDAAALPFNFWGGLVGCLGYELKAECGGAHAHASPTPDAALLLADQLLAVDHAEGGCWGGGGGVLSA